MPYPSKSPLLTRHCLPDVINSAGRGVVIFPLLGCYLANLAVFAVH